VDVGLEGSDWHFQPSRKLGVGHCIGIRENHWTKGAVEFQLPVVAKVIFVGGLGIAQELPGERGLEGFLGGAFVRGFGLEAFLHIEGIHGDPFPGIPHLGVVLLVKTTQEVLQTSDEEGAEAAAQGIEHLEALFLDEEGKEPLDMVLGVLVTVAGAAEVAVDGVAVGMEEFFHGGLVVLM